jgi:hypothetical protein
MHARHHRTRGIGTGPPSNRLSGASALLVVSVVVLLDSPTWGQDAPRPLSSRIRTGTPAASPSGAAAQHPRRIGVPQVVEISLPEPSPVPAPSWHATVEEQSSQNQPPGCTRSHHLLLCPGVSRGAVRNG